MKKTMVDKAEAKRFFLAMSDRRGRMLASTDFYEEFFNLLKSFIIPGPVSFLCRFPET